MYLIVFINLLIYPPCNLVENLCEEPEEYVSSRLIDFID